MDGENKEIFRFQILLDLEISGKYTFRWQWNKVCHSFFPIMFFYNILTQCPFSSVNSILSGGKREEFMGEMVYCVIWHTANSIFMVAPGTLA